MICICFGKIRCSFVFSLRIVSRFITNFSFSRFLFFENTTMGLCIGSLGSTVACCFGNAFCSLCCAACPSMKGSTSTRIAYGLILLAGLITSCIMLIPGLEKTLAKIPALCSSGSTLTRLMVPSKIPSINCSKIVGFSAVYRLSFGMTCFFLLLFLAVRKHISRKRWLHESNGFCSSSI